ncbi:MAG: formylmethanofuran--tetrahydromethanopterin N-formyltransferase [Euryarchaeota archaeon]|nr:formylmethanofuran--tetrahydromethanopterin N-formyltransferase [Euryarchaeota archaeon]
MKVNGVTIDDTYAEAFPVYASRVLITAATTALAETAALVATGFATSVIGCSAEAGIDRYVLPNETPDGRPGVMIMVVHPSKKQVKSNLVERVSECVLTAATTAVFNGLDSEETVPVKIHYFGDGYEYQTSVGGRSVWAIPILEGDFICEETYGVQKGVAGGNFFIYGDSQGSALLAAQAAVDAIKSVEGTITPFPGGIVASGSKVGCPTYSTFMKASTHHRLAPTLREKVPDSYVPEGVKSIYEIVICGLNEEVITEAMKRGMLAATHAAGIMVISAGNYGGELGPFKFHLHEILREYADNE